MALVLSVLLLFLSLFLMYQGMSFNGIINMNTIFLKKFESNNILLLVRAVLNKYTILLGVVGILLALFLLYCRKKDGADEKVSNSFWVILISFVIIALFTVI